MHLFASIALLLCALVPSAPCQAIIAQTSGLANPSNVISFGANLYPNFTPITTQFPGLTVTHASYFTRGVVNNLVGGFLTNNPIGPPDTLRLQLAQPVTAVSFVYHQVGTLGPSTIRALLNGVQVDSFSGTWTQFQPNNYFGFTNTLLDEVQIDFVLDFNVDTLAYTTSSAQCLFYNGSGINPTGFACTTLPVLGTTWQGQISLGANTVLTLLAYAEAGVAPPLPLFGGELLLQLAPEPMLLSGPGSYSLVIPASPSWTGTQFTFQGFRVDCVADGLVIVPLNVQTLVLGP